MTNNFNKSLALVFDKLGLIISPVIIKLLSCIHKAAEQGAMVPCALLKGLPGGGKTSTAEAFALAVDAKKFFYQCNPGTGVDQLIGQPNLGAVLRQDAAACISDGILIQAAKAATEGQDVVLILDEIDKSSQEVDAYLLDFLQSRRIRDSNMEEIVIPTDVKFWVFLTANDERELSDALMRRVRRVTVDRPSRSTVASVLGIQVDTALIDIWEITEKLAISQLRNYLEDGGDPQNIDLDILSQYVDDLPDLSTLAEQAVYPEISTVPTVMYVGLAQTNITSDLIQKIGAFRWLPEGNQEVLVEVSTLTELIRLHMTLSESKVGLSVPVRNIEGPEHRMIIDHLDPVVSNHHGGIFVIPTPSEEDKEKIVTIVARRDAANGYYISGDDFRNLDDDFFKALAVLAKDLQRDEFKVKHAEKLNEARKAASEGQAQSLLKKLGLDDLL